MTLNTRIKRVLGACLAMLLLVVQLFANQTEALAASKQPAINYTDLALSVGQSHTLKVSNAKSVKWTSSDKAVASVSSKGTVKAKKAGKATITASASGKKFTCNIVVSKPSSSEKDVLIVYFSQTGTTKKIAQRIQKLTGGDLLRIRPKKKYTSDYDKLTQVAQKELRNNTRPKVTTGAKNIKSYDVIYVGYPIWWGTTPRVVNTFLEKYNLSGKTVIPFCTSGGSDIDGSLADLEDSCKGAVFKEGYTADSGSTAEIQRWLTEIGELENSSDNSSADTTTPSQTPDADKLLVVYFSWSGTSERIAQNIIAQTGADSFRIERETPYSTDYTETAYGDAQVEAETNARPPIKNPPASIAQYDKIVLCYPIWWHTAPMTVGTFLESYDMSGKTIYPISQSASMDRSQYEQSVAFIRDCAKGATVDSGLFTKDNSAISNYISQTVLK